MGLRKETRLRLTLPVRVCGESADGELFEQDCTTVDLTLNGVQVQGLRRPCCRGTVISIMYGAKSAPARVIWSEKTGHAGLQIIGAWKNFWGRAIPHIPGDGFSGQPPKPEATPDSEPAASAPSDESVSALLVETATDASPQAAADLPAQDANQASLPDVKQTPPQKAKPVQSRFVNFLPRTDLLQRMSREPRLIVQVPVRVFGMSKAGRPFVENAMTENVSRNGVYLSGLPCEVKKNEVVIVSYQDRKGPFRVMWSGKHDNQPAYDVGLRSLDLAQSIWAIDFTGVIMDECGPVERRVWRRYVCTGGASIYHPDTKHFVHGTVADISLGGCYVEIMTPLNVHDRIALAVHVNGVEVRASAEVRTTHPGMGMGLKFRDLAEKDAANLQALIAGLGRFGTGQIDILAEGNSRQDLRRTPDPIEIVPREYQKQRSG